MNVSLDNDDYRKLAEKAQSQQPPQLTEQYAANIITNHLNEQ